MALKARLVELMSEGNALSEKLATLDISVGEYLKESENMWAEIEHMTLGRVLRHDLQVTINQNNDTARETLSHPGARRPLSELIGLRFMLMFTRLVGEGWYT